MQSFIREDPILCFDVNDKDLKQQHNELMKMINTRRVKNFSLQAGERRSPPGFAVSTATEQSCEFVGQHNVTVEQQSENSVTSSQRLLLLQITLIRTAVQRVEPYITPPPPPPIPRPPLFSSSQFSERNIRLMSWREPAVCGAGGNCSPTSVFEVESLEIRRRHFATRIKRKSAEGHM